MRGTIRDLTIMALAVSTLAACIKKEEEKPAEEPPAAPFVAPPEPARAAFVPKPDTQYTIQGRQSNKCLQFAGANANDSAPAEIWACNGTDAQFFTLKPVTGGYYNIISVRSKKCLDVTAVATGDSAPVGQFRCLDGTNQNQEWILADGATPEWLRILARHSGKGLDVEGEGVNDGVRVNQYHWKGMPHQEWKLVPVVQAAPDTAAKPGKPGKDGTGGAGGKAKKKKG